MSDALTVGLIAAFVGLMVAFVNNFLAESYRRFRDGCALAASLAGELAAYDPAGQILEKALDDLVGLIDSGARGKNLFRATEKARDLVYEDAVKKLGLLGAALAEDVVFVYSNINSFRASFEVVCRHGEDMTDAELKNRCIACKEALERATGRGRALILKLRARAEQKFAPEWPFMQMHWTASRR